MDAEIADFKTPQRFKSPASSKDMEELTNGFIPVNTKRIQHGQSEYFLNGKQKEIKRHPKASLI